MATATVLGLFFVPVFFVVIRGFFARRKPAATCEPSRVDSSAQGE